MHHALLIQEILLAIFSHWHTSDTDPEHYYQSTTILAALARTCRSFKDTALDILWSELIDLSPLPRCVPEACRADYKLYSFKRRLNENEWATLLSYTRRIRHIRKNSSYTLLENGSLVMICDSPAGPPLFPNLRTLFWEGRTIIPAMHVAVPSLTTLILDLRPSACNKLKDFLNVIGDLCRDLNRLHIHVHRPRPDDFGDIICNQIQRNLAHVQELKLDRIIIDADMIKCLSEMSTLKHLSIKLDENTPPFVSCCRSAYVFPALVHLELSSVSPAPVTEILSCIQLPALEDLETGFTLLCLKMSLTSFISAVQKACAPGSLASFRICGFEWADVDDMPPGDRLSFNDLYPCTAFTRLQCLVIDLPYWTVALTDGDMHALVSAWPHLHTLSINETWGWRCNGGITFRGLVQILNMCPSLVRVCMAIDTASHTDLPPTREIKYFDLDSSFEINFADAYMRSSEDVLGLIAAIQRLGLHRSFAVWYGSRMSEHEDGTVDPEQIYLWKLVQTGLRQGPLSIIKCL